MKIGAHQLANQVILAPMAGVTDLPYRNICRQQGVGAAVAEMITSNQKLWQSRKSSFRQVNQNEKGLRWIQILGNDPEQMADAARECEYQGAEIIDINLGCPAKKVCKKAAGSALLQQPELVEKILKRVVDEVNIPVTVKIRSGWSKEHKNAMEIGKRAEQSGVSAISVHGRTRECRYDEAAEYQTAKQLKQAIRIPVIVNGDIDSPEKAANVLKQTAADAVMIGRAALGNPWLLRSIDRYLNYNNEFFVPDKNEVLGCVIEHVKQIHEFYGPFLGLRIARKHVGWYEDHYPQYLNVKSQFNKVDDCTLQLRLLEMQL